MSGDELSDKSRKIDTGSGDYQEGGRSQEQRVDLSVSSSDVNTERIERSAERAGRVAERLDIQSQAIDGLRHDVRAMSNQLTEFVIHNKEQAIRAETKNEQVAQCHRALFGNGRWGLINLCRFSRVALTIYFIVILIFVFIVLSGYTEIMHEIDNLRAQVEGLLLGGGS
jgi:uncharacterized protein YoxC